MEEPFKPLSLSIRELFGNADALYKIPQYQRPYKWEDEQIDKLWDDVYESYQNGEENYFLGSIITAKPRDNEKSAYVDVVDGQQRLTTLMIMFCVVRDLYPDINAGKFKENPFVDLNKDLHLEHILPVKYKNFSEWNHITDDIATKWLNSTGNITLLGGAKNIEASNNPFKMKMGVYKGKGKYDEKNDKISAFLITQSIVKDYEANKYQGKWNLETMKDRWKWFFAEVEEILEIDVGKALEKQEPELV
jgi:uncharacterized protein with ParB-like and HNH nuclease domain